VKLTVQVVAGFTCSVIAHVTVDASRSGSGVVGRVAPRVPELADGLRGLEETRRRHLQEWMDASGFAAVVFPTLSDVAPADADVNEASADIAWRNGVWVATGDFAIRHCGVPTVTVPLGPMPDIGMPSGLTFADRAYDDAALLAMAAAFETPRLRRTVPPRTPALG
jgi:amidase